jgi:hypothetical protein
MKCLLLLFTVLPFQAIAQNQWHLFDSYFPDTQWTDTLEFTYGDVFRVKDKFYLDSTFRIDRELRNALLPDSLKRQSIPMYKWQNGDTTYYYSVEDISTWNWGYLYVKVKGQDSFLSIIQVLRSEPGDGGQLLDYAKITNHNKQLKIIKTFNYRSTYYPVNERNAHITIQKRKILLWNFKLNNFIVKQNSYSKDIWYHKP